MSHDGDYAAAIVLRALRSLPTQKDDESLDRHDQ